MRRAPLWLLTVSILVLLALALLAGEWAGAVLWPATPAPAGLAPRARPPIVRPTQPARGHRIGSPTARGLPSATPSAAIARPAVTATPTRVAPTPTAPPPIVSQLALQPVQAGPALPSTSRLLVDAAGYVGVAWRVVHAAHVYLNGAPVQAAGRRTLAIGHRAAVVLTADNESGAVVTRILALDPSPAGLMHVTLSAPRLLGPRVRSFTGRPDPGTGRVILRWSTAGASEVILDGARVAAAGRRVVSAAVAARHVLVASSPLGTDATALDVSPLAAPPVVRISPRPPTIAEFTLMHPRPGQPYALRWRTVAAGYVALDGLDVAASGSLQLMPPVKDHTYTLVAKNADGETRASVQVQVR